MNSQKCLANARSLALWFLWRKLQRLLKNSNNRLLARAARNRHPVSTDPSEPRPQGSVSRRTLFQHPVQLAASTLVSTLARKHSIAVYFHHADFVPPSSRRASIRTACREYSAQAR